jgi:hypothetical protein
VTIIVEQAKREERAQKRAARNKTTAAKETA